MNRSPRILLYSHDTFGLGHLRRNRKIADAILRSVAGARIILATGSDLAGRFPPLDGMETVRLPAVTKLDDGSYRSPDADLPLAALLNQRAAVLERAVAEFCPDIFIADKEPLGLLGELKETLRLLGRAGTYKVLGLRDVLDDGDRLRVEWDRRGVTQRLPGLYDEIWIYGPDWFYAPLDGLDLPRDVLSTCRNVGFLGSHARSGGRAASATGGADGYILVTAGGGEDGEGLMNQVLAACECDDPVRRPLALLPGPLMAPAARGELAERASRLADVRVIDFQADPSPLIAGASGVVAMCGYNTFCEVLEADRPVLFVPREQPRLEQFIRAKRAAELGAARLIRSREADNAQKLAAAINALPDGPRPSAAPQPFAFDGLDQLGGRIAEIAGGRAVAGTS
ncbi:MAG: glycosyltransferase [Rhizobiaceae bacterium]